MSLAGARTHENETRPEEIYDHQRVCIRKLGFEQGLQKLPGFLPWKFIKIEYF